MKKSIISVIITLFWVTLFSQAPQKVSYQAVIRDSDDHLVCNQQVGMKISILQGSAGGTAVYVETQTPVTNTNGLVSIETGNGTIVNGDFALIDWSNGPYFIKTETDPTGSTSYSITGTSQILSVPYALHAETAETVTGVSHYLGEEYLDGIIFYLYTDNDGHQHGLIVSKNESTAKWQNTGTVTNATRSWDGDYNTGLMNDSPAKDWITTNYNTEWYLPSIDELGILRHNRYHVNKGLNDIGATILSNDINSNYWSSTERNTVYAFSLFFYSSQVVGNDKASTFYVRAIRAF